MADDHFARLTPFDAPDDLTFQFDFSNPRLDQSSPILLLRLIAAEIQLKFRSSPLRSGPIRSRCGSVRGNAGGAIFDRFTRKGGSRGSALIGGVIIATEPGGQFHLRRSNSPGIAGSVDVGHEQGCNNFSTGGDFEDLRRYDAEQEIRSNSREGRPTSDGGWI